MTVTSGHMQLRIHARNLKSLSNSLSQIYCDTIWRRGRFCIVVVSRDTRQVSTTRGTKLGDRAFLVAAVRAWNALPASVRTTESHIAFRRQIKTAVSGIFQR